MRSGRETMEKSRAVIYFYFPGRKETGSRAGTPWSCMPAHTIRALTRVQINVADQSTPVQAGQGLGPLHGAVMGGCDQRGTEDKRINVVNESLRAMYFTQAAEVDICNL